MNRTDRWRWAWAAVAGLLLAGCAQVNVRVNPKFNLATIRHPYVIHLLTDGRSVDRMIAQELRARGYDASYGPRTEMPRSADAAVVYQDTWTYDFTTYMIALDLQVRTPRTDYPIAVAHYRRPSLTGGSATVPIDRVIDKIFPAKAPLPPLPPPSDTPDYPQPGS